MRDAREQERVVRVVLPVKLIRQLDESLQERLGGFETRAEFIREAVENMLLELKYEPAQPELHPALEEHDTVLHRREAESVIPFWRTDEQPDPVEIPALSSLSGGNAQSARSSNRWTVDSMSDLTATLLSAPSPGAIIEDGAAEVVNDPLFGLHNRDYPSIWAAHQLAALTREGPVPLSTFFDEVTRRAWLYAEALRPLEQGLRRKLTVMFPRNPRKPQSAEEGFRDFAVGSVTTKSRNGRPVASGPLFSWKACQLHQNGQLMLGLTDLGYELLAALDGISLDTPHSPEMAERFFAHLRRHAPGDWWGFETALDAVAEEPDRNALLAYFKAAQPHWSDAVVGTNSQGYVGRGREWGLIEPRQIRGRYFLTAFGRRVLENCK